MYRNMAKYYDEIFPSTAKQRFLCRLLEDSGMPASDSTTPDCENRNTGDQPSASATPRVDTPKLLDIGCSNGRLAWMMAQSGYDVTAFDLSSAMIAAARNLVEQEKWSETEIAATLGDVHPKQGAGSISFMELDMLDVAKTFAAESFDFAYCIGNTLVHLTDDTSILQALQGFSYVLKPAGVLVIQILPYARILENRPPQLPLIESDVLRFERFYDYVNEAGETRIHFRTRLTIKETGTSFEGAEQLYPISQKHLEELLHKAGLQVSQVFGSFAGETLGERSPALILVCRKRSKGML